MKKKLAMRILSAFLAANMAFFGVCDYPVYASASQTKVVSADSDVDDSKANDSEDEEVSAEKDLDKVSEVVDTKKTVSANKTAVNNLKKDVTKDISEDVDELGADNELEFKAGKGEVGDEAYVWTDKVYNKQYAALVENGTITNETGTVTAYKLRFTSDPDFTYANSNLFKKDEESYGFRTKVTEIEWGKKDSSSGNIICYFTKINKGAFYECTGLKSLDLSKVKFNAGNGIYSGISTIEAQAFQGCKNLKTVIWGDHIQMLGDRAFSTTGITEIEIPESLTGIGDAVFYDCESLETVTVNTSSFGNDINRTSDSTFGKCKISTINFKEGLTGIPNSLFYHAGFAENMIITLPESIENIGNYAFAGVVNLASVKIDGESQLKTIGNYAFQGCTKLTNFQFVNTIQKIGDEAFSGCQLSSVDLRQDGSGNVNTELKSIGASAFKNNNALLDLKLPSSLETIGDNAFQGCTQLGKDGKLEINCRVMGNHMFEGCTGLTSFTLKGVNTIGSYAFNNCTSLTNVTIPSDVSIINGYAFASCKALKSVNFVGCKNLTEIPMNCFYGDENLVSLGNNKLVLPDNIKTIAEGAFYGCSKIYEMDFPKSLEIIGKSAFSGCSFEKIVLPENLLSVGETAFNCNNLSCIEFKSTKFSTFGKCPFGGTIRELIFSDSVEVIPDCFMCNVKFTDNYELRISKNVKKIGSYAFGGKDKNGRTSFEKVIFAPGSMLEEIGDYSFAFNPELKEIDLPVSLKKIGAHAFDGCVNMVGCTIPENVTSIGFNAFANCSSLGDIHYNAINATTGIVINENGSNLPQATTNSVFYNSMVAAAYLGPKVESLPAGLLLGATFKKTAEDKIEKYPLVLPPTVEKLPSYALAGFKNVDKLIIANENLSVIGDSAFMDCSGLEEIIVNNTVKYDESKGMLLRDEGADKKMLPESLKSIGKSAFKGCSSLKPLSIPGTVETIGSAAFQDCVLLDKVTIPENVKEIADNTFNGCKALTELVFSGNKVTSIGSNAFAGSGLEGMVDIPGGVNTIMAGAFANCTQLREVDLPTTLNKIDSTAFSGCNLEKIYASKERYVYTKDTDEIIKEENFAYDWIKDNYPNLAGDKYCIKYNGLKSTDINNNDGSYRDGEEMKLFAAEREGYSFINWFKDEACTIDIKNTANCTGDLSLYAKMEATVFNITYVDGGTKNPNPTSVNYGTALKLETPTKTGSAFEGWFLDEEFKIRWVDGTVIKEDYTLYAKWREYTYVIQYDFNGGKAKNGVSNRVSCVGANPVTLLGEASCSNGKMALVGWNTVKDGTGTHYECGEVVSAIATNDRETIMLYAEWSSDTYAIQYVFNKKVTVSANILNGSNKSFAAVGKEKKLLDAVYVTYPGYELVGWSTKKNGKGDTYAPGEKVKDLADQGKTIKLYPIFEMRTYTVEYVLNDDEIDKATLSDKIKREYTAKKPAKFIKAKRVGYKFAGWYLNYDATTGKYSKKVTSSKNRGGNLVVYAKWTPIKYSVIYDKNGGTLTADGKKAFKGKKGLKYNEDYTILEPTASLITNDGATFAGWNTKKDGSGTSYVAGSSVNRLVTKNNKKVKLFAQWK